jgi:phosphatidylinositol-3-phosphatase
MPPPQIPLLEVAVVVGTWEHSCNRSRLYTLGMPLLLAAMTACGGGGSSTSSSSDPASPTITSVTVACPSPVVASSTAQCAATIKGTGSYSSAVTWSASSGSINATGDFTAPASAGSVTVTATSTEDPTKSGSASITVTAATPPSPTVTSVQVTCNPSTVNVGASSQCSAAVSGTGSYSSAVTWSATSGSINSSGRFTAPASAGSVAITATSIEDPTQSGSVTITVTAATPPPPTITSVQVTCNPSTVNVGATSQCSAAVAGTGNYSPAVTWSASGGSITLSGLFTAPSLSGAITVTATSVEESSVSGTATVTVQQSAHIVLVMEENQSYATVVHNTTDWPNLNQLIANGALPTNYFANTHPSIGNYFMLTTGQILTNDDSSKTIWDVDNIARRMLAANIPFRIYAEGITQGYVGGNTGLYLVRHNPFALLSDIANNPQVANQTIWPFSQFAIDLANGNLPEFSYIVPDVNDDAHNGTPQQADTWLQTNVVLPLSSSSAFASGGDGLLIVNFDEAADSDTRHGGGQIAPVFWGPLAKTGYTQTSTTLYQHQSMLNTMMIILGLQNPPAAAATAPSMSEFLQK